MHFEGGGLQQLTLRVAGSVLLQCSTAITTAAATTTVITITAISG